MSTPTTVLALDTALAGACAAVRTSDGRIFKQSKAMVRGQAEALIPLAEELMVEAGLRYEQLDVVITTIGPGAFTGLRLGMSAAKAFGLALGIPVYGVSTMDAMAYQYGKQYGDRPVLVVIETKRKDFYAQLYPDGKPLAASAAVIHGLVSGPIALIGDANDRYLAALPEDARALYQPLDGYDLIDPAVLTEMAAARHAAVTDNVEPLYLRGADVSQSKRHQRPLQTKDVKFHQ